MESNLALQVITILNISSYNANHEVSLSKPFEISLVWEIQYLQVKHKKQTANIIFFH